MLTNQEILQITMTQSAYDINCSAWSNIPSVRNAMKSGFLPAWVEMTVKPAVIVDEINK